MASISTTPFPLGRGSIILWVWAVTLLLTIFSISLWFPYGYKQHIELQMLDKGGGKNAPHANPKAQKSAAEQLENIKKELDKLNAKPSKTKEDNDLLQKLEKRLGTAKK